MSTGATSAAFPKPAFAPRFGSVLLSRGLVVTWFSVIVLIPLAFLFAKSLEGGPAAFWEAATEPQAIEALRTTLLLALAVAAINSVMGTMIAWVLVRDEFPGKAFVNSLIDLPFALPTLVAGITLLALYGNDSPIGIDLAYTAWGVMAALLFVTLPFVVRSVQPTLIELDREIEEAAASLGASSFTTFRRVILPSLRPAILAGAGLAFAKAIGEFGSLILLAGTVKIASIYIFAKIESNDPTGAAAVSVVLLLISVGVLLLIGRFARFKGMPV
jgi:sulfate/thiosulfate transport system permease protein